MQKKLLKLLVLASYKNNRLDEKAILTFADQLDRTELKQYIKALKISEKQRTVFIDVPFEGIKETIKELETIFSDKKIILRKDPSLVLGIRITNNDDIIDMNLKSQLESMVEYINK